MKAIRKDERCAECDDRNEIKGFEKVIDVKDRVVIYVHNIRRKNVQVKNEASVISAAGKVFVVHNKQDVELKKADMVSALESNQISCPRCRHVAQNTLKLLGDVPTLNKNDLMGICTHCRTKLQMQKSCDQCEKVINKFIAARDKHHEETKNRDCMWLSKVNQLVSDIEKQAQNSAQFLQNKVNRITDMNEKLAQTKEGYLKSIEQKNVNVNVSIDQKPIIVLHPHQQIAKYSSDESIISIPRGLEDLDEGFMYYFPKVKDKKQHQPKSENSAELIRATRERLKADEDYKLFLKEKNKMILSSDSKIYADKIRYEHAIAPTPVSSMSRTTTYKGKPDYTDNIAVTTKKSEIGQKDEIDAKKLMSKEQRDLPSDKGEHNVQSTKLKSGLVPAMEKRDLPTDKQKRDLPSDKQKLDLTTDNEIRDLRSGKDKRDMPSTKAKREITPGTEKRDLRSAKIKPDLSSGKEKGELISDSMKRDMPGKGKSEIISDKSKRDIPSAKEKRDLIYDTKHDTTPSGKEKEDLESENETHKMGDLSSKIDEQPLKEKDKLPENERSDLSASRKPNTESSKDERGIAVPKQKGGLQSTKLLLLDVEGKGANLYDKKMQEKDRLLKQKMESKPKEIDMKKIKIKKKPSALILKLMNKSKPKESKHFEPMPKIESVFRALELRKKKNNEAANEVVEMNETSESDDTMPKIEPKLIRGEKIIKFKQPRVQKPSVCHLVSNNNEEPEIVQQESVMLLAPHPSAQDEPNKGILRYALSDRTFIEKGWTKLPTEKIMRRMNVFRMRPAYPEFDWFERHKNKQPVTYDTGEVLSMIDENGRGRWYYRNGRLALDYYDAEELNAGHRYVVYSSGEPDERGRTYPITVLATFDYLGNGVVFDHSGKIRLKYNQTEGVVLDRAIGPVSHWKWHALNDPPVLKQVMIDTETAYKDPNIVKLGPKSESVSHHDEKMLTIELENFAKEKIKNMNQEYRPFQIKMKALKINEYFSLKVLDQSKIYLIFRDGSTNLKLNLGMLLDHHEILDTDAAELGDVSSNLERLPTRSDSLAGLREVVNHAQCAARIQTERHNKLRVPVCSADKLVRAVSRPLKLPLKTLSSSEIYHHHRKPSTNNLYYNTRIV